MILHGQFVEDALAAGLTFGLIGSTDSHGLCWHHGIHRRRDPFNAGLAAVHATDHTRSGILDALRRRHCYATSGPRILLDVDADGAPMGSDLGTTPAPQMKVSVHGFAPVKELAIVCDGETVHVADGPARTETSVQLRARGERQRHVAFARVLFEDGDMAWASPIWWQEAD